MSASNLIANYLSDKTRRAHAASQTTIEPQASPEAPLLDPETRKRLYAAYGPSLLAHDIQARIHSLIFGPDVKSLDEAKRIHQLLVGSLDAETDAARKKSK